MPTVLVIFGLVVTAVGVALIVLARFERPEPTAEESLKIDEILKQFNELLKLVQARYRIGVVLIAAGLALVGVGAWWEARDARSAAEEATPLALVVR